jgi:hypothetical protein
MLWLARRLPIDNGPSDTDANAGKFLRPEGSNDRFHAVLSAMTALLPNSQCADRQVQLVIHHENSLGGHAVPARQIADRIAASIYEGLGLYEDCASIGQRSFRNRSQTAPTPKRQSLPMSQFGDAPKTNVVPVARMFSPGIAKPDDEDA